MNRVWDWIAVLFIAAAVYVLVRPRSRAAELVGAAGSAMSAMTRAALDIG